MENKKYKELEAKVKIYEDVIEEKNEVIKENDWYKVEYERIIYSFSYRLMNKLKRILIKIHLYSFLRSCLNIVRKVRGFGAVNITKISEYKYFKFKQGRNESYSLDANAIKHDYISGLVSIVLPVYNGESYLEQTIKSIINQSYHKFELIIINDGSTDKTEMIAKKYVSKDARIKLINQSNQKLPKSISNGFRQAKGEFYMWVSADDLLHKDCLKLLVADIKEDNADFVYANARLIDEDGNPLKDNKWYSMDKEHPEYVILPSNTLNFNIIMNNYISPITMYKSIVVKTLEDYSSNRFTVEDYEYYMKINNIFKIRHTYFKEPIFDYRRHGESLSSKSKELKVVKKADELMLFEDFRRDYLMLPMMWNIDTEDVNNPMYIEILNLIKKVGHTIVDKKDLFRSSYSKLYKNQVYLYIGNNKELQESNLKQVPKNIYKVILSDSQKNTSEKFDLYLTSKGRDLTDLGNYKGWFKIEDAKNIFSFIDTKTKHTYLKDIESYIQAEVEPHKKLSIIICTYKRSDKLNNVIRSAIDQTTDRKDYEIIVVNNDIATKDISEIVNKYRDDYKLSSDFLKYYEAPVKGLSFARNVGMFAAEGKINLYLDDDSVAFKDLVEKMIEAYNDNLNAGVVGGQIILKLPKKVPDVFLESKAAYWSQFLIEGKNYKKVREWYQFPYGANFSVERNALLKVGGFRTGYGRVGHNFLGGEEVVVSLLVKRLDKDIILAPLAKVYHDVDESRYTVEHIEKTDLCGAYTRNKLELDLYKPIYYLVKRNSKRELQILQKRYKKAKDEKERIYILSNIKAHRVGLKDLKNIAKDMQKMGKNEEND